MNALTAEEIEGIIKQALKDASIKALITDARVSIVAPDGRRACYQQLDIDTEK